MGRYLSLERLGHTAIVTLSHPPVNLFTLDSLKELAAQFEALGKDESIRSVVMTGAGESFFSAGTELAQFSTGDPAIAVQLLDAMFQAFGAIRHFDGVTVAAINGFALGAGLECALSCDYIVMERGAKLGMPQARFGLVPIGGGAKLLVDKIGESWTKRMVLGGEQLDAETACRIGLVEELADPGLAKIVAMSLANRVVHQGPLAVREARGLIAPARAVTFEEHIRHVREALLRVIGSDEQMAGVAAFLERRSPPWIQDEEEEEEH